MASGRLCTLLGCNNPNHSHGLCKFHAQRKLRGMLDIASPQKLFPKQAIAYLRALVGTQEQECIPWPFRRNKYGQSCVQFEGQMRIASRLVHIWSKGEPPTPTHEAAHNCGKGHLGCVNPNHLRWATAAENHADKKLHGTTQEGSKNGYAKLHESQVRLILAACRNGAVQKDLAVLYEVSPSTIHLIANGKHWSHVYRENAQLRERNPKSAP